MSTEAILTELGSVEMLACTQLAAHGANIRDASRNLAELSKSLKEVGQFHPLIVVPVDGIEGTYEQGVTHVVIDGNRRLAAAAAAGIGHLRCEIRTDLSGALEAKQTMLVTNLMRDGLTATEEAHAVQGMLDLGMSAAAIGRATGRPTTHIKDAKKAATITGEVAAQAHELTLHELAILADYQDNEEATAALIEAAGEGRINHQVARLEQNAREAAAIAQMVATLGEVIILERRPSWDTPASDIDQLVDAEGNKLTEEGHRTCPGHAVHVGTYGYDATDTRAHATVFCLEPKINGHSDRYGRSIKGGPMTAAEKEERQTKIANNKELAAAAAVRLEFIRTVITGKGHHKSVGAWALNKVINHDRTYARWVNRFDTATLATILGTDNPEKLCREAPASEHALYLWAHVAAAYEAELTKEAWQHRDPERGRYLQHLTDLGYVPCETELIIIGWAN